MTSFFKKRKLAEHISFFLSVITISSLIILLSFDALNNKEESVVKLIGTPHMDQMKQIDDQFIVPITLKNLGKRSVSQIKYDVSLAEGDSPITDIQVNFLAGKSSKVVYLVLKFNPTDKSLKVEPISYQLD